MRPTLRYTVPVVLVAVALLARPSAQQNPPAGPGPGAQGAPGVARGGGRGNPAAALYTEQCAGCHGTDAAGARAKSVFAAAWLEKTTDEKIVSAIRDGVPGTEMHGFGKQLDAAQIWSLVQYIRTQTSNLIPKPQYVADPAGATLKSEKQTVKVEVLTKELDTPFGLAFLPDGRLLITERPGRLRIFEKGQLLPAVRGTPPPHVQQDGGFLDVEVHPQYAKNGWIYLSYSEVLPGFTPPPPAPAPDPAAAPPATAPGRGRGPQIPSMTVVVRGKISKNNEWTDQQVIFRAAPELYTPSGSHFGLRFVFDQQGHLFYSLGERGAMQNGQDLKNPLGKIHRVNDDGTIPKDNPFVTTPGAVPTIWSYGHRNPQGLAWDPVTGKLWSSEHGPGGGDEINVIERGHNYGWGVATKGTQGGITKSSEPGMDDPVVYFTPALGPGGMSFYTGNRYPRWRNTSLFVSGLVGQRLLRLEIAGDRITKQEVIFDQFGRVRDIIQGPDGYFYIALQNPTGGGSGLPLSAATPGTLIRLMPVQ